MGEGASRLPSPPHSFPAGWNMGSGMMAVPIPGGLLSGWAAQKQLGDGSITGRKRSLVNWGRGLQRGASRTGVGEKRFHGLTKALNLPNLLRISERWRRLKT